MNAKNFLLSSLILYGGAIVTVLLTCAFYVISLRISTEAYGELQAMLSFMFLLYAGRGVAGSYVVIHTAGDEKQLPAVTRVAVKLTALIGVAIAAGTVAAAPFLREFLRLDTTTSFYLIGISAIPCMAAGFFEGVLNIQKKFVALSTSTVLMPLANVLLALVFFRDGFHESDAGWIVFGTQLTGCLAAAFVDWSFLKQKTPSFKPSRSALFEAAQLFTVSLLFGTAVRSDVFWAKHILTPIESGGYAIASSIAIVLYLITSSVGRITSVSLRAGSGIKVVVASYASIVCMSALLAGGFFVLGDVTLRVLVGKHVDIDWFVLWRLFAGFTCYTIIMLDYGCLNIVTKRVHVGIGLILLVVSSVSLFVWGNDAHSIATARFWTMLLLMAIFSISLIRAMRKRSGALETHVAERHLVQEA